jgi:glycosyltransferase involved in cell wall biosynthesis
VGESEKAALLGGAKVMLFPIDWAEPFGMVMIESLACGTPVVAFNHGSVSEVIDDGKTGFIVSGIDDAVDAVRRIDTLSRATCRRIFVERFTNKRMAKDYVHLYEHLIEEGRRVDLPLSSGDPDNMITKVLSA